MVSSELGEGLPKKKKTYQKGDFFFRGAEPLQIEDVIPEKAQKQK